MFKILCVMQVSEHETSELLQICLSPSPTHFDCATLLLRAPSGTIHSQESVQFYRKNTKTEVPKGGLISLNIGNCSKILPNGSSSLVFNHYPSIRSKDYVMGDGAITCE